MSRLEIRGRRTFVVNHPEVLHELLVEGARTSEKSDVTRFALCRCASTCAGRPLSRDHVSA